MSRRFTVIALATAAALAFAGCAKQADTNSDQADSGRAIKIGAAVSDTGTYSVEGKSVKQGYEFWEDEVNKHGGIDVDGTKRRVNVVYYDDQSDPETAIKLTQRLISEDKVDFVFGPYSSGMTIATSAITQQYKKIMFAGGAAANSVFQQHNKYLFSPLSLTSKYTVSGLDLLKKHGATSVGILHTDEAPMIDVNDATEAYAKKIGLKVTSVQSVPADSTDVKGALRQIQETNPDVLVEAGTSVIGVLTTRTLRDLDWAPETLMVQAPTEDAFVDQLGVKVAKGILAPTQWEPSVKFSDDYFGSAADYTAGYKAKFGHDPSYLAASASAAALTLQIAVKQAGSIDTEAVRKALVDLDVDTFFGPISYSAPDDASGLVGANLDRNMLTLEINDQGKRVIVAPDEAAGSEFTPMKDWNAR